MLSCCLLPFSAANAGDYEDMEAAFDANLAALRQVRANIQNNKNIAWPQRKKEMDKAQWEIDRAVERQTAFKAALANIKARNPHNAQTTLLRQDLTTLVGLTDNYAIKMVEVLEAQGGAVDALRDAHDAVCDIYKQSMNKKNCSEARNRNN